MEEKLRAVAATVAGFFAENARPLPWRRDREPYHVFLSEIMLQQTRVEAVKPYYERFLSVCPSVGDLAALPEDDLLKLWEGLGYYSRARNLQKAAQKIVSEYHGVFPRDYDALLSLPGVGGYTAGAIGSISFGLPCPAIDGNLTRIWSRLYRDGRTMNDEKIKKEIRDALAAVYPTGKAAGDLTQGFMEIGQRFCIPHGAPDCAGCPLRHLCDGATAGDAAAYPVKTEKKSRRVIPLTVFLLHFSGEGRGTFAVRKRPENGLLAGTWEFPNTEGALTEEEAVAFVQNMGYFPTAILPVGKGKHIFTHLEWHMTGYIIECAPPAIGTVATPEEILSRYPIASAFRVFRDFITQ